MQAILNSFKRKLSETKAPVKKGLLCSIEYNVPATIVERFTEKSLKIAGVTGLLLRGTFRKCCNCRSLEIVYNPNALQKYFLQIPEKYSKKYSFIFIISQS